MVFAPFFRVGYEKKFITAVAVLPEYFITDCTSGWLLSFLHLPTIVTTDEDMDSNES
jgi:hypothetical protein